ncbi:unnamed protein product, partial [marine sediment metagenome]
MIEPDHLVRIYYQGTIPSIFNALIVNYPDRQLTGEFYEAFGFEKPGKVINLDGKDVQALLVDCNTNNCT